MEIAFHIGVHCTDDDRIVRTLQRNSERLATHGVAVPRPEDYRKLISDVISDLRGAEAESGARDALLEAILQGRDPQRMILSNDNFVSADTMALAEGQFYPRIHKTAWLRNAFPGHAVSFHVALRNPASFVPALSARLARNQGPPPDLLQGTDPRHLLWSDMIERLRQANPGCEIVVWSYEDTPLLFGEVIRDLAGVDGSVNLHGGFDMLRHIMSHEGLTRLRAYTKAHPPSSETARRRIAGAFLDKFGVPSALEDEIDLPGWTEPLVEELTGIYEADLELIGCLPGVRLLEL